MRAAVFLASVLVIGLTFGSWSLAQTPDASEGCIHAADADLGILYCSSVIKSGNVPKAHLAIAYYNRGNFY